MPHKRHICGAVTPIVHVFAHHQNDLGWRPSIMLPAWHFKSWSWSWQCALRQCNWHLLQSLQHHYEMWLLVQGQHAKASLNLCCVDTFGTFSACSSFCTWHSTSCYIKCCSWLHQADYDSIKASMRTASCSTKRQSCSFYTFDRGKPRLVSYAYCIRQKESIQNDKANSPSLWWLCICK